MFKTLINAWNVKDIRTKMLYTLLLVVIYRFGSFIPVPGVDASKIAAAADTYSILSFLNLLSGGNFGQFTIFAMGITPYITGSIIIQLLTIAIPSLEKMAKEEDGREKLERITRYTGIGLALVQSIGIVSGLQNQAQIVTNPGFLSYATIGIVCTAGTAFLVWLGERITEKGIGNGISFIIFASIVSSVPQVIVSMVSNVMLGTYKWWILPVLLVFVLIMVAGVVAVDRAVRRIPVQYAKRVVGRKMYGGQSTNIPLKANANGVMPLIFAMTLMQVPGMIGQFWPNGGFYQFYQKHSILCDIRAAHRRLRVLLQFYLLQPNRDKQEPSAERRLYPRHPPGQAHRRISCQDMQPPHSVRCVLPYADSNNPCAVHGFLRPQLHVRPHQHTDNGQRCSGDLGTARVHDAHASLQGIPRLIRKGYVL